MTEQTELAREQWMRGVVEEHEGALVRYAFVFTRDVSLARDIVQDVFLKLWQAEASEVRARVKPWLFLVCRNRALDVRRKENRIQPMDIGVPLEMADEQSTPDRAVVNKETNIALMKLVDSLPDNQQEVIRLKFQSDLSYQEIAQITRLSVSNVGFLLHTAVKNLRQKWSAAENQTQTL